MLGAAAEIVRAGPSVTALIDWLKFSGKQDWKVVRQLMRHPEISLSTAPLAPAMNLCPWPIGGPWIYIAHLKTVWNIKARERSIGLALITILSAAAVAVAPRHPADTAGTFQPLSNALRHTPPRGSIRVIGEHGPEVMRLAVGDRGEGLNAKHLASVFNRFYRVDKSRSRETVATGLGPAIVKAIVEPMAER
jgi:hypothetical protein